MKEDRSIVQGVPATTDRTVIQSHAFDYSQLDAGIAEKAEAAARRIRNRLAKSVVEIGHELLQIKEALKHGQFTEWLDAELGLKRRSAENYMNAARLSETESASVALLPPTALYDLAAPNVPEDVRKDVLAIVSSAGRPMKASEIRAELADRRRRKAAERHEARETERRAQLPKKRRMALEEQDRQLQKQQQDWERRAREQQEAADELAALLVGLIPDHLDQIIDLFRRAAPRHSEIPDAIDKARKQIEEQAGLAAPSNAAGVEAGASGNEAVRERTSRAVSDSATDPLSSGIGMSSDGAHGDTILALANADRASDAGAAAGRE